MLLHQISLGIASDHAGFELKQAIIDKYESLFMSIYDYGCHSAESVDYPDYAHPLANAVEKGACNFGIAICGSGNGINMTINKHQGIRGALCWDTELASLARQHNNANILTLPARFISQEKAFEILDAFFATEFEGGRHICRVDKIANKAEL